MTAQGNNDDFDDELLSAYVDGELTAAERARVEERLRSDPAAAALVDELRSLSSEIQRLPREPLGRDLRSNILAEIDQARADLAAHGPATLPELPIDRWAGIRRGLVWSALAIAATIVIAIFQPPQEKQAGENVARAKKVAPAAAAPQAAQEEQEEQEEAESEQLSRSDGVELQRADDDSPGESANDQLTEAKQKADELPPAFRAQMSAAAPPAAADPAVLGVEIAMAPAPVAPAAPAGEAASTPLDALAMESSGISGEGSLEFKEAVPAADAPASVAASAPMSAAVPQEFGMTGGVGGGGGAKSVGQPLAAAVAGDKSLRGTLKSAEAGATSTVTLQLANEQGAEWFRELLTKSDITPTTSDRVGEVGRSLGRGMRAQGGTAVAEGGAAEESVAEDKSEQADTASRKLAASGAFDNEADRTELADAGGAIHRHRSDDDRFYFFSETLPSMHDELLRREANHRIAGRPETSRQVVWVEASKQKIEQLLAECRAAGTVVKAVDVAVVAVVDGATTRHAMAPQQLGEPQASVAGAGQAAETEGAFGGALKAADDSPMEPSGADARVRVLFVLQSPRIDVAPAAAPASLPTVAPPTTGEAR